VISEPQTGKAQLFIPNSSYVFYTSDTAVVVCTVRLGEAEATSSLTA